MTVLAYAVAAALALVAAAATAYAAVGRQRAAAALVAAAVLATSPQSVPSLTPLDATTATERWREVALVTLAAVVVAGVRRALVWVALGAAVSLAGPLLLEDPFRDATCEGQCTANPWALLHSPTAAAWAHAGGLVLGVLSLLVMAARERSRLAAAACAGLAAVWLVSTLGVGALVVSVTAGVCGLVAFAAELARAGRQRSRLRTVVDQLAHAADAEAELRARVPGLQVEYRLDGVDGWVDREGVTVSPTIAASSIVIRGPEGAIARVINPGSPTEVATWSRQLRGPARLALDNARRSAQSAYEANEIAQSSRRLVTRADEERRRLERDLHDGAQQHVLALGLLLSLHLEGLDPDDPVAAPIQRSQATVSRVLDELRDLSHGIHPAALDSRGGLRQALELLADRSPVPLEIAALQGDPDSTTRCTAYALVEEVAIAADAPVRVETRLDTGFAITVTVDGGPPPARPQRSSDRFRALGGALAVQSGPDGRHTLTGTLPIEPIPTPSFAART